MRVVVALGGNALLRRGEPLDAETQRRNVAAAAEQVATLARDHETVITHGNGPQVGLLSLQAAAWAEVPPYPLDVLDAESAGWIGYVIEQELGRHLPREQLATVLTQVLVESDDPAFIRPTKFVGPVMDEIEAHRLADKRGWDVAPDGAAWRRVVPSPDPQEIVEIEAIRLLVENGITVICAGGGGIPVMRDPGAGLIGVEAVIDKDLASALLACELGADALLLLTDVEGVFRDFGTSDQALITDTSVAELRALDLPAGSMGPKIEAACRFVEAGGSLAAIGSLSDAGELLDGSAGTTVHP